MFLVEMFQRKTTMPTRAEALAGRAQPIETAATHAVSGRPLKGPFPDGMETACFAMGRFTGAEKLFWPLEGVHVTAVGYAQGLTPNPTYKEVCSGRTGHNEVVLVVYDPRRISYEALLKVFFESHDPTQVMRQGNDIGTQYRSGIYTFTPAQRATAERVRAGYESALRAKGYPPIATEIAEAGPFYFAEDYHQQYLAKVPHGYCGLGGTGVTCPVGTGIAAE